MDNQSSTHERLRELALFAGAGGGILGGTLLGWRTVCAVEIEPYAAAVLCARQNDGVLSPFPIWDDVRSFDGNPWRGIVDVISGGFPCQDISIAGKGKGLSGERSGLWSEMARIIGEVRPRFVLVENSPMLTVRGGCESLETLPKWGMTAGGELYPLPTLELRIKETGCGLLPTPLASTAKHGWPNQRDSCGRPGLQMAAAIWPTPTKNGNYNRKGASANSGDGLATKVKQFPTPTANDAKNSTFPSSQMERDSLIGEVMRTQWPTPRTKGMCGGSGAWGMLKKATTVKEARGMGAGNGGTLNPTWVEWLMGWPLGWTDLQPLETDKFLTQWLLRGKHSPVA